MTITNPKQTKEMTLWKTITWMIFITNTLAVIVLIDMIAFRYPVITSFLLLWGVIYLINKKYFIVILKKK